MALGNLVIQFLILLFSYLEVPFRIAPGCEEIKDVFL